MTKKMLLVDVFKSTKWAHIEKQLLKEYPDEKASLSGYKEIYDNIISGKLKPKTPKTQFEVMLKLVKEKDFPFAKEDPELWTEEYYDVYGVKKGDKQHWALEWNTFNHWLSFTVSEPTIKKFGKPLFLANVMYEMTFCGFTNQEILAEKQVVVKRCKEVDKAIEKGDMSKFVSLDEMLKKIDDKSLKTKKEKK